MRNPVNGLSNTWHGIIRERDVRVTFHFSRECFALPARKRVYNWSNDTGGFRDCPRCRCSRISRSIPTLSSLNPIPTVSHHNHRSFQPVLRREVKRGRTAAPSRTARPAELLAGLRCHRGFVTADCKVLCGWQTRLTTLCGLLLFVINDPPLHNAR